MCHICRRLGYTPPQPVVEEDDEAALAEAEATQLASSNPPPPAPRKQIVAKPQQMVITEPAPSYHDAAATTTWAAYAVPLLPGLLQGDDDDNMDYSPTVPEEEKRKYRPIFGLRIYDAAADASPARAKLLARRISALTHEERVASESAQEDRIEVVAFPLSIAAAAPAAASDGVDVERIDAVAAACIAHSEAERAARLALPDAGEAASWYVADDLVAGSGCRKRLWIVDGLAPSWEEALRAGAERWRERIPPPPLEGEGGDAAHLGHFLNVMYDRTAYDDEEDDEREMEGLPRREFYVRRRPLDTLGRALADFRGVRGNVHAFYTEHFIPDGVLDRELAPAREASGTTTA